MQFTGERLIISEDIALEKEHLDRYNYASQFVPGKKVLDMACGTGYGSKLLKLSGSSYVLGIDISSEAVNNAKSRCKTQDLDFIVGSAENVCVRDKVFDLIISFETIEHLNKYSDYLKEIKRLLKDDGLFIISTPNKKFSIPNPYHLHEFYLEEFRELLLRHFYEVDFLGQDYQTLKKRIMRSFISLIPRFIRNRLVSKRVRDNFNLKQYVGIVDKGLENCRFFIVACKNLKR